MLGLKLNHVSKRGHNCFCKSEHEIEKERKHLEFEVHSSWTHWGLDKIVIISQITFSNWISWMKMYKFHLRFNWSFFPKVWINNILALVQIMAQCRPGNKLLSKPMIVSLQSHICIIRPQWVNISTLNIFSILQLDCYLFSHKVCANMWLLKAKDVWKFMQIICVLFVLFCFGTGWLCPHLSVLMTLGQPFTCFIASKVTIWRHICSPSHDSLLMCL